VKKSLLAFLLTTSSAQAAPIPYGDFIQWYSGGASFNFANQTFEYANDIALPTNATGAFAQSMARLPLRRSMAMVSA
jgi:hypothetical protein